ncbi:uncharacterized protein LOC113498829 [Trichoplusia ni]|uniref:Uncharacterized protein LOC113498829 n=1 Tax=Trichoplusia ni TaxID=7111 RepID=A0A7E5W388_TRINI|nr:uncharacterized protein LOC113498829 [Trichoplusia ni]
MTREVLTKMNYILELVTLQLFCITAYFCAFTNRCTYVKIINGMIKFVEPPNINMEQEVKRCRNQVNVILVFLLSVFLLQICVNFTRDSPIWKTILVCISFLLPQMIQFTVIAFYYVLVLMLIVLLKNVKLHLINLIKNDTKVMDYYTKAETKITTLQYMESLYSKAFEMKREIIGAFQAPLLVTTLQCFHSIVSEAHIIYHGLVVEREFSLHSIFNCSIWIIYQIIKIYIISRSGSLLKQEIQHFSSLMSYQGEDMTAYGLVNFDSALLSKITASSAMYLTILVQFDKK